MAAAVKAVAVDNVFEAYQAGRRGAFEFFADAQPEAEGSAGAVARLRFVCPGCGELGGINFSAGGWTWDGNREAPTCTPSILHDKGRCGWHGYLTAGEFRPC